MLVASIFFQPTDGPNAKRLMEIQSPMKDSFSMPNAFFTSNDNTPSNRASDTA